MSDLTLLFIAFALLVISISNLVSYIDQIKSTTLPHPQKRKKRKKIVGKYARWLPYLKSKSHF